MRNICPTCVECGKRTPAISVLQYIAEALEADIEDLVPRPGIDPKLSLGRRRALEKPTWTLPCPRSLPKGSDKLFFEVLNRGREVGLILFNNGPGKDDLGNGFLMERGDTVVWAGWQPDGRNGPRPHSEGSGTDLGYVTEADFDRVVDPFNMVKPYVAT